MTFTRTRTTRRIICRAHWEFLHHLIANANVSTSFVRSFVFCLYFAARKLCETGGCGLSGTATGPQQIDDPLDDLGPGGSHSGHGQCPLPSGRQEWHLLCPRQCFQLYNLVQVGSNFILILILGNLISYLMQCLQKEPKDHRVPAVRNGRSDHAQKREACDPVPPGGGTSGSQVWYVSIANASMYYMYMYIIIILKLFYSITLPLGMLAPMLVQMERQIDREIAADIKANGAGCSENGTQTDALETGNSSAATITTITTTTVETDLYDDSDDSETEDDGDQNPVLMYGPQPQIITNDLKSLDEMVSEANRLTH